MKKYILCAIAALFITSGISHAQNDFKIGPKAGIAASWIPGTTIVGNERIMPHNSFYAGLSAEWEFTENVFAQIEALYAGKGHSDRTPGDLITEKYNLEIGYVQVPLFGGYKFFDGAMSVMAGPEFGFAVMARTKRTIDTAKGDNTVTRKNVKDAIRPFNIALALQVSYEIWSGLGIDAKLSYGLNRTFKKDALNPYGIDLNDKGHNVTLQLGVFYKFEL